MSREHIYPEWLWKYLGGYENERFTPHHLGIGISSLGDHDNHVMGIYEKGKDIPYKDFAVKCVCEECNNGWMSHLENSSKSIFERLLYDELNLEEIEEDDALILAKWAVMKSLIVSQLSINPPLFADEFCMAIKNGNIPEGFVVDIHKTDLLRLNFVSHTYIERMPLKITKRELAERTEGFFISGIQLGGVLFRTTYLDDPNIHRIQVGKRISSIHPYKSAMPYYDIDFKHPKSHNQMLN